jgi:anthranilate phosphoribosyltransferase
MVAHVSELTDLDARIAMRSAIQKVATGPEYSKDLSLDEARLAMQLILSGRADEVQAAILLIALRMKRETDDENRGVLTAIMEAARQVTAPVDEVIDVADPYDGYTRGLPVSPFLPPVFAACGLPAVSHGLESVGPKYGVTHRKVLRAAGIDVDLPPEAAAGRIGDPDIGWAYVDQRHYCKPLHDLVPLRQRIVKRPVLTTVEVLVGPVRGRSRTHLYTGYVHKAYPPVYTSLARHAGLDSAIIARGVEGGVIPSLQQPAKVYCYRGDSEDAFVEVTPTSLGIEQRTRAVPIPKDAPPAPERGDEIAATVDSDALARFAAEAGIAALEGRKGPARDSLVYAGAIGLWLTGRAGSLADGADQVRKAIDSGAALDRLRAAQQT